MYNDVKNYVKSCLVCQTAKRDYRPQRPPLQPLRVPRLFSTWHVDVLGPLPPTKEGYKYILLCVESLSRWPEIIPMRTQEATEIADGLFSHVFARFGCPDTLISDRGINFLSMVVKRLCALLAVHRSHTSSYNPQANGAAERFNSTILTSLRCYLEKQEDWVDFIPAILMAYRSTVATSSSMYSPFYIMHGVPFRLPVDTELQLPKPSKKTADEYIRKMIPKLEVMRKVAKENVEQHQLRFKDQYDRRTSVIPYKPGDKCWLYNPKTPIGLSRKLFKRWMGPYFVIRQTEKGNYILADCKTKKEITYPINVKRMKPFNNNRDVFDTYDSARNITQDSQEITEPTAEGEHPIEESGDILDDVLQEPELTQAMPPQPTASQPRTDKPNTWEEVEELAGVRMIEGIRHYFVMWRNKDHEPKWIPEDKVSEALKTQYHVTHTLRGTRRPDYRKLKRRD
jgi:transposase InsO family protein